jgi:hypothetical protein
MINTHRQPQVFMKNKSQSVLFPFSTVGGEKVFKIKTVTKL